MDGLQTDTPSANRSACCNAAELTPRRTFNDNRSGALPPSLPSSAQMKVLMLTDQAIARDRRVQLFMDRYAARGWEVDVLNVLNLPNEGHSVGWLRAIWRSAVFAALRVLPLLPGLYRRARALLHGSATRAYDGLPLFSYSNLSLRETAGFFLQGALRAGPADGYSLLHANDLRCLIFAMGLRSGAPILYDSHEFNPFRNRRRMSWLRILANCGYEAVGVTRSRCVATVAEPIARAFSTLYGRDGTMLIENRYFPTTVTPVAVASQPVVPLQTTLLYFGALASGRALLLFNEVAKEQGVSGIAVIYDSSDEGARQLRPLLTAITVIEQQPQTPPAIPREATTGALAYSWCALEDVGLSYRYALPNKFFQSLALELPIIAAEGTYLAKLVRKHGLGLVIDLSSSPAEVARMLEAVDADRYSAMRHALRTLARTYASVPLETVADRCIDTAVRGR